MAPGWQAGPRNSGTARVPETMFTSVTVSSRTIRLMTCQDSQAMS